MVGKKVSLYIDNQSIIKALRSLKATSGQFLIRLVRNAVNQLSCRTSVRWISSHSEVKGNEEADKLAKEAAAGRASSNLTLPPVLRAPLPRSASATKQDYMATIQKKWREFWSSSPRRNRIANMGGNFPFSSFRKSYFKLTRPQSSRILQVRSNHIPLNAHLHRIGKSDTDKCPNCNNEHEAHHPSETVNHFIFECPKYDEARSSLIDKIGRRFFHLSFIMSNTDNMKALATYINRTGRFKNP